MKYNKMLGMLLIAVVIMLLTSCVTQNACNRKFPPSTNIKDSTHVEVHDTTVTPKESSVGIKTPCDSIKEPIVVVDSTGQTELILWKDKFNNLVARCNSRPKPITIKGNDHYYVRIVKEKVISKPEIVKVIPQQYIFYKFCFWIIVGIISISYAVRYVKNKFNFKKLL